MGRITLSLLLICGAAASSAQQLVESGKRANPTGTAGDGFGKAIAVSGDGRTLAVGSNVGSVYIYADAAGTGSFALVEEITTPGTAGDHFGRSCALSRSGAVLAVGAPNDDHGGTKAGAGAVFTFARAGATYSLQARVEASDALSGDGYGESVALSGDASALAAGAWKDDNTRGSDTGSVYTYRWNTGAWAGEAFVYSTDVDGGDFFSNHALALSGDGTVLAVGAVNANDNIGTNTGGSFTFSTADGGASWTQDNWFPPFDGGGTDNNGFAIALSGDGLVLAAGAHLDDDGGGSAGSVYVWDVAGGQLQEKVYASDRSAGAEFGRSVAINDDGSVLLVGAFGADSGRGAAYILTRSGSDWTSHSKLVAADGVAGDSFGFEVALSDDGAVAVVAATDDNPGDGGASAVYSFAECTNNLPSTLDEGASGIAAATLALSVLTDASHQAASVAFVSSARTVDAAQCSGPSVWAAAADGCATRHSFARDLATTLDACGFEGPTADAARGAYYYESTVEVTTVSNTTVVFGDEQNRTDVTSFRVRVEYADATAVSASAGVFGPAIDLAQLTTQVVSTATREFTFTLATSVQWPYYLVENGAPGATGGAFEDAAVATTVGSGGECDGAGEGADQACTQRFELKARTASDECSVSTTVRQNFTIACRAAFTGSCDLPDPSETFATFDVETANLCPEVVEVASITPELTTYSDSDRTSVSTNYILETTLSARVTADVEAGLQAKRTTLTGLDIVSSCSTCTPLVQPFPDTSAAATAYGFAYVAGGTDNSATGEVETDFSFTLNTNSLSFDNDATTGEAQITLTAYVTVEYDTPSAQGLKRSYRVAAVSGPGSIGSSASANFGVSSAPAGGTTGGSSSTAGSTVLGVSTGTAALAAVGLAVVAAVAFGAAVSYRRRARPSATKRSSSTSSLELGSAADNAARAPTVRVENLARVEAAYAAVQ